MALKPCLTCGILTNAGSYCQRHLPLNGSTRQWRNARERIMARDLYLCQQCGAPAQHVDHIIPVAAGGSDDPHNLRALCAPCNLRKGDRQGIS